MVESRQRAGRRSLLVRFLRGSAICIAITLSIAALAFFTLTGRLSAFDADAIELAAYPGFRTWEEHREIYARDEFPYIVEIEGASGALLYIGIQHSTDPGDEQWDVLRESWAAFAPTVALNEGRTRYFRFASVSLGGISDPKLAFILAREDNIPIYSLEPTYQVEVDALLEKWPADLVATYLSLRVISSESGGIPDKAESIAPGLVGKRTNADGLRDTLSGVADLDAVWAQHLPDEPDWRTLTDIDSIRLLREIGDDAREVRGKHMVRSLTTLVRRGERVVAVVGASHVIRHEPTLRALLSSQE